jgi:hypothetical protein
MDPRQRICISGVSSSCWPVSSTSSEYRFLAIYLMPTGNSGGNCALEFYCHSGGLQQDYRDSEPDPTLS